MFYNLCDIIRFKKEYALEYKDTIAYEYLIKQGPPYYPLGKPFIACKVDFQCIKDIVTKRRSKPADPDTFAIQIRAFDLIGEVPHVNVFLKIIKKYKLHKRFKNCLLFYGNHNQDLESFKLNATTDYLNKLKNNIEELNINCSLVSKSVDEDFVSLATAKCYIAGFRGFGWLAASINPNEVIWDIQKPPEFPWQQTGRLEGLDTLVAGYEFYLKNKSP